MTWRHVTRRRRLLAGMATVLLAGSSCGGDDERATTDDTEAPAGSRGADGTVDVRPFAEVQSGDIVFEADPTNPTRGIFRVTTTVPMICAIVWGEDDSLGRFNNSLAMNGTGIAQHDVVLPDLESGVEYRYLVQGTTADGTLYRSPLDSFRIELPPEATPAVDRGDNLALDATVVESSSEFSADFAAELAIDGDTATEWSTSGDGDEAFVTIDLGADRPFTAVEFVTRSMADGSAITDAFTLTVDDGPAVGPFPAGSIAQPRVAKVDGSGRLLRFDIDRSTGGNVGAVEIRVFDGP